MNFTMYKDKLSLGPDIYYFEQAIHTEEAAGFFRQILRK